MQNVRGASEIFDAAPSFDLLRRIGNSKCCFKRNIEGAVTLSAPPLLASLP